MIGVMMSKKVNPDPKTRLTYHVTEDKSSSKAHAETKTQEMVDIQWEATPTWNIVEFKQSSPTKNDYKLPTEDNNTKSDDSE